MLIGAAKTAAMLATHLELWVFLLVYLGMLMGRLPWLRLDRTGIALLGAIALVAAGRLSMAQAFQAVDLPTISLLFALMVVSAQLRLGGFYACCARRIAGLGLSPPLWLGMTIFLSHLLLLNRSPAPSRYIHTSDAETYRPIAEIVEKLNVIETEVNVGRLFRAINNTSIKSSLVTKNIQKFLLDRHILRYT